MPSKQVYLSLGSNLGDRGENLKRALGALAEEGIQITARSSVYETEPQDVKDQPWFYNLVIACQTSCFPLQLLAVLQKTERNLGRKRRNEARRGPRLIDIDVLLYGDMKIATGELVIPHPRMYERRFVLEPLLEIAPELRDPVSGTPIRQALERLHGQLLRKIDSG